MKGESVLGLYIIHFYTFSIKRLTIFIKMCPRITLTHETVDMSDFLR